MTNPIATNNQRDPEEVFLLRWLPDRLPLFEVVWVLIAAFNPE
ncbi:MAG TPA: hypothetical protein P5108_02170 [Marmoricola sp.]|jgi:hypothetical protein|nr:hypothetical protein [Marmoricola sp.]HMY09941.1 hypothetical protein [Marmoricola sp.]HRV68232.1 hypothetical protein [Marmoricola sp.]